MAPSLPQHPADERHQSDAQAPIQSSLIAAAVSLARSPYLRKFVLPWTSANCVIARLHPQLSHLCGEGFQSASDGGSRYILQSERVLLLYTTSSNRFIIVFSSAKPPRKYLRHHSISGLLARAHCYIWILEQHVVTTFREGDQGSVPYHS